MRSHATPRAHIHTNTHTQSHTHNHAHAHRRRCSCMGRRECLWRASLLSMMRPEPSIHPSHSWICLGFQVRERCDGLLFNERMLWGSISRSPMSCADFMPSRPSYHRITMRASQVQHGFHWYRDLPVTHATAAMHQAFWPRQLVLLPPLITRTRTCAGTHTKFRQGKETGRAKASRAQHSRPLG